MKLFLNIFYIYGCLFHADEMLGRCYHTEMRTFRFRLEIKTERVIEFFWQHAHRIKLERVVVEAKHKEVVAFKIYRYTYSRNHTSRDS